MTKGVQGYNKQFDIVVEPGIQRLYESLIGQFPKLRGMSEKHRAMSRTARKRYYENYKKKRLKNVDK